VGRHSLKAVGSTSQGQILGLLLVGRDFVTTLSKLDSELEQYSTNLNNWSLLCAAITEALPRLANARNGAIKLLIGHAGTTA
jgi:hypothetical protein